jgi:hypothetical protein
MNILIASTKKYELYIRLVKCSLIIQSIHMSLLYQKETLVHGRVQRNLEQFKTKQRRRDVSEKI